jgi:ligand-binding SRPBCC domain-containing protein
MSIFYYRTEQWLPADIQKAWAFFASPNNLALITPPEMNFTTLTNLDGLEIHAGMRIDYKIKPLFGIPMHWQTEITHVQKPFSFTDIQLKGPYRCWQHTHTFKEKDGGVLMEDVVKYQLPFGALGMLTHALLVRKKIGSLFAYRKVAIERIFT